MNIIDQSSLRNFYLNKSIESAARSGMFNIQLLNTAAPYSEWLRNYLIWRIFPELFIDFSPTDRYLNIYYWFKGFYELYKLQNGIDAGIEQQIVILLEEISNNVVDFDWNIFIELDQKIENEILI